MKKTNLLAAVLAAAALTACNNESNAENKSAGHKCKVVKDGVGKIKAERADCAFTRPDGTKGSCAGQNAAGDASAWIYVDSKATCDKINAGDFTGVDNKIKDKIEH